MPARQASYTLGKYGFVSVAGRLRRLHKHPTRTSTNPGFARVLLTAVYGPVIYADALQFAKQHTTSTVQQWSTVPCSALSAGYGCISAAAYGARLPKPRCSVVFQKTCVTRQEAAEWAPVYHLHPYSYTAFVMTSNLAPGVSKCSAASLQPACLPKGSNPLDHSRVSDCLGLGNLRSAHYLL